MSERGEFIVVFLLAFIVGFSVAMLIMGNYEIIKSCEKNISANEKCVISAIKTNK